MFTKIDDSRKKDYMHSLSQSQRRHALLNGYIRLIHQKLLIPKDIRAICVDYMKSMALQSRTDIEQEKKRRRTPLRITVFGAGGVGKSTTIIRYITGNFVDEWDPTIEDYYRKIVELDGYELLLEVMDTTGVEFGCYFGYGFGYDPHEQYMRESDAFVFLYSVTSRQSFNQLTEWYRKLKIVREAQDDRELHLVVAGNKSDLEQQRQVSYEEGEQLAKEWKCGFLELSAKEDINVEQPFEMLMRMVKAVHCIDDNGTKQATGCHCHVL